MASAYRQGKKAQRKEFDRASTLLRFGPTRSASRERQYTDQFTQAAGQPLGAVSQAVAASNLGGQRMPGQQTPMDIASQAADKRQQATALATQQVRAENQAMMEQAKKTVDEEMKERRARRARALAIGAALALPAAGPISGALGAAAGRAAEGSFKRNFLAGASKYLSSLQTQYGGGGGSSSESTGDS